MNKDVHTEAMRYVANASEFLRKAGKEGAYYSDPRYVKIAGNTLWNGVLLALQTRFPVKGRPNIDKYRELVASTDKKKRKALNACYERCHLSMGYDGHLKASTCRDAVELANELIAWAAPEPVVVE